MTCEFMHTASKEWMAPEVMFSTELMPQISITDSKVKWLLYFTFSYVQPITQRYKWTTGRRSTSAINPVTMKNTDDLCVLTINYSKAKVAITLRFQLCSACFTALQMKNSRRSASAINPVTTENTDNSHREAITLLQIDTFGCQQKREMGHKGGQR